MNLQEVITDSSAQIAIAVGEMFKNVGSIQYQKATEVGEEILVERPHGLIYQFGRQLAARGYHHFATKPHGVRR